MKHLILSFMVLSMTLGVHAQTTKTANVNLYGNSDPAGLWNWIDWDVTTSLSKSNLTFDDATPGPIDVTLSAQTNYFDNGSSYTGFTMCEDKIGRYGSYHSGSRTLTFSGLGNSKLYTLSFVASKSGVTASTVFTINGSVVTVPVGNNKSTSATFENIAPTSGAIVVNISNGSGSSANYLNAFRITEKTFASGPPNDTSYATPGGTAYTITPDVDGRRILNDASHMYQPGDTLYLSGHFKTIEFTNLLGAPNNYIVITNVPGQVLTLGDSTWDNGSWSSAAQFIGCKYIEVVGSSKNNFRIIGSKSTTVDSHGVPYVRQAYFNLRFPDLSSNVAVHNISIREGGTGIWAKTEVSPTNSQTWHSSGNKLRNWAFFSIDISNTAVEAMYIGHTGTYWNIQNNIPHTPMPNDPALDTNIYKQPVKLSNVVIRNVNLRNIGNDGIQTAAIDTLEVYHCRVTNWATNQVSSHNGGILIGGRVKHFYVHDNIVHNGWGEFMQIYAQGGARADVINNLMYTNGNNDGVSMKGTDNLIVTFSSNTVAYIGRRAVRVNGYFGQTGNNIVTNNILAEPQKIEGGTLYASAWIYLENGGAVTEGSTAPNDNKKFSTGAAVNWNEANYFLPNSGSTATGYGYNHQPPSLFFVKR